MKGILEKLQKTRGELDAEEKKKVAMDTAFMTTKKGQVESARTERGEKEVKLTETKIALVKAQAQLKRSGKQIAEVTQILDQTKKECDAKKLAWADRQKDRKNEKGAIAQAIDFIKKSGHGASLAQAPEAPEAPEALEAEQAPSFVQMVALPEVEPEELSLRQTIADSMRKAMTVGPEDTKGALGVINKLIAVLAKQQSDEDGKKAYCEKELDVKADEKVDTSDDLKQLAADAESKKSTIATLVDEVEEMEDEVVKMAASLKEATNIRKKEKASFQAGSKDRELAVKVLRQAMRVLENFYKTAAPALGLVEQPETKLGKKPTRSDKPKTWSATKGPRKKIGSNIVIEMLDKVSLEIVQEEKKARKAEAEAQTSFEQLQKETRSETDRLRSDITERVKSKAKLVVQANAVKETVLQRKDDLKAIKGQEKVLKEECTGLLKNYAARKKSRAFESDQLKDVKDILRGAGGGGSRTSLVESNSLMTDREATLLSDMEAPKATA
jgi:hypothetical protein